MIHGLEKRKRKKKKNKTNSKPLLRICFDSNTHLK
uniref:Uncharacterized protein n=1 Tax=Arundo donax TaxID=35708 RepID=A0A0A9HGS8_ARUDO